jgi:hypothetical protein
MNPDVTRKLNSRQLKAIEVLLREPRIDRAAEQAGVARITLWRWLQQPAFSQAYRDARSQQLEQTMTLLQSYSLEAVAILVSVWRDKETIASTKVAAARSVLEFAIRSRELLEVEDRIRALEMAAGNHHGLRSPTFPA